jgi:tetratricopeptide (TPR) repeat protein
MRTVAAPLLLLLCAPALSAQTWKDFMSAGVRAAAARNFPEAEKLLVKASEEASHFGETDTRYGTTLNTLGLVYRQEKKYALAEATFERSHAVLIKNYGAGSPDVANVEYNLAGVEMDLANYSAAIENYRRALPVYERWFGRDGAKTGLVLQGVGECYRGMNRLPEAEKYFKQAAAVRESSAGIDSPELGETMNSLGLTYSAEGNFHEAEAAYKLALSIREAALGLQSELVRATLENYAAMLQKANRPKEAARLMTLAVAIRDTSSKP